MFHFKNIFCKFLNNLTPKYVVGTLKKKSIVSNTKRTNKYISELKVRTPNKTPAEPSNVPKRNAG